MGSFLTLMYSSVLLVNFPYTLFLLLVLLYWISVIAGTLDLSLFDVDFNADADVDLDIDADVAADADLDAEAAAGSVSGSSLIAILRFFNFGEIPVMIIISFLALSMWTISIIANDLLNNTNIWIGTLLFPPNLIVSLFIAKFLSTPFNYIFKKLHANREPRRKILGELCTVITSQADEKFGQAEIQTKGAPITLNVRTEPGIVLHKGEQAFVFKYIKEKDTYIVIKLKEANT